MTPPEIAAQYGLEFADASRPELGWKQISRDLDACCQQTVQFAFTTDAVDVLTCRGCGWDLVYAGGKWEREL